MKLIDGDKLEHDAGKLWEKMPDGEELSKELMKCINRAPIVDAVQVIRCESCVHFAECESEEDDTRIYGVCDWWNRITHYSDYCADGERRESE